MGITEEIVGVLADSIHEQGTSAYDNSLYLAEAAAQALQTFLDDNGLVVFDKQKAVKDINRADFGLCGTAEAISAGEVRLVK